MRLLIPRAHATGPCQYQRGQPVSSLTTADGSHEFYAPTVTLPDGKKVIFRFGSHISGSQHQELGEALRGKSRFQIPTLLEAHREIIDDHKRTREAIQLAVADEGVTWLGAEAPPEDIESVRNKSWSLRELDRIIRALLPGGQKGKPETDRSVREFGLLFFGVGPVEAMQPKLGAEVVGLDERGRMDAALAAQHRVMAHEPSISRIEKVDLRNAIRALHSHVMRGQGMSLELKARVKAAGGDGNPVVVEHLRLLEAFNQAHSQRDRLVGERAWRELQDRGSSGIVVYGAAHETGIVEQFLALCNRHHGGTLTGLTEAPVETTRPRVRPSGNGSQKSGRSAPRK